MPARSVAEGSSRRSSSATHGRARRRTARQPGTGRRDAERRNEQSIDRLRVRVITREKEQDGTIVAAGGADASKKFGRRGRRGLFGLVRRAVSWPSGPARGPPRREEG